MSCPQGWDLRSVGSVPLHMPCLVECAMIKMNANARPIQPYRCAWRTVAKQLAVVLKLRQARTTLHRRCNLQMWALRQGVNGWGEF